MKLETHRIIYRWVPEIDESEERYFFTAEVEKDKIEQVENALDGKKNYQPEGYPCGSVTKIEDENQPYDVSYKYLARWQKSTRDREGHYTRHNTLEEAMKCIEVNLGFISE